MDATGLNLSQRVRSYLLDYCQYHITTDYAEYSLNLVNEVLSEIPREIPEYDPKSLFLPLDPFTSLIRITSLDSLPPYNERAQSNPETIEYIKSKLRHAKNGREKSSQAFVQREDEEIERLAEEPLEPVLSSRASRETPVLGSGAYKISLPNTFESLIGIPVARVRVDDDIQEHLIRIDDVLKISKPSETEDRRGAKALLRSVATMCTPKEYNYGFKNTTFSDDDSPSNSPETEFVPIFPRNRRRRAGGQCMPGAASMEELALAVLPQVKMESSDDGGNFSKHSMAIIDEWQAFCTSSPSIRSPGASDDEEFNQLFNASSPPTELPPVEVFESYKMEVPQLPRVKRIGSGPTPAYIGAGNSIDKFLQPYLGVPSDPRRYVYGIEHAPRSHQTAPTHRASSSDSDGLDIDSLYVKKEPWGLILDERLPESELVLLDIPKLPPPNIHPPNTMTVPNGWSDFLVLSKLENTAPKDAACRFLKPLKGMQSLQLSLSWNPFASRDELPDNESITGVSHSFTAEDLYAYGTIDNILAQVAGLFHMAVIDVEESQIIEKNPWLDLEACDPLVWSFDSWGDFARCDILLTRIERGGSPISAQHNVDRFGDSPAHKRRKLDTAHVPADDSGVAFGEHSDFLALENAMSFREEDVYQPAVYHFDEDDEKENRPFYYPSSDGLALNDDMDVHLSNLQQETFEPLIFESQQPADSRHAGSIQTDEVEDAGHLAQTVNISSIEAGSTGQLVAFNHSLGISQFVKLRAKQIAEDSVLPPSSPSTLRSQQEEVVEIRSLPSELYDDYTVRLPEEKLVFPNPHRYMASLDVIQKQVLMRSLHNHNIDLVVRDTLGGVDLIIDCSTAVIFAPLLVLPSECESLTARLAQVSWSFSSILVVFEAYPESWSIKPRNPNIPGPCAYTPPIVKKIKKLRRDLEIARGCGTRLSPSRVMYAFANSVDEAALFVRLLGENAEGNDHNGGVVWGARSWLDEDPSPDEESLASVDGLNHFSASIILCQVSLDQFINFSMEERAEQLGYLIGLDELALFEARMEKRYRELALSDDSINMT